MPRPMYYVRLITEEFFCSEVFSIKTSNREAFDEIFFIID